MGRTARGNVYFEGGRWKARITMADKSRRTVLLPLGLTETEARDEAVRLSQAVRLQPIEVAEPANPSAPETVIAYSKRIVAWKLLRGHSTASDTLGRLRKWVWPVVGPLPIATVSKADLESVVRHLDSAVATEKIEAKTAANVWGDVTGMCNQACKSKDLALRVRSDDPTRDVLGPDGGIEKRKPILFADEVLQLLQCESVPAARRRIYAFAIYFAARANEIAALTAADFDLQHQAVTIARQRDRKTNGDKRTKTKRARGTDIEAAILPLVTALCTERPKGRLFEGESPTDEERAVLLRADLLTARVLRRELHVEDDPTHLPMWFHHLRDTGLTWMAIRGDDPLRIQWRGGHTDFATTQKYIAQGRMLAAGAGFRSVGPFPEIPPCILPRVVDETLEKHAQGTASPTGFEAVGATPWRPLLDVSGSSGSPKATAANRSAAHSAASAWRYSGPELGPRESARLARDANTAAGLRRCVRAALEGDRATLEDQLYQSALSLGGAG